MRRTNTESDEKRRPKREKHKKSIDNCSQIWYNNIKEKNVVSISSKEQQKKTLVILSFKFFYKSARVGFPQMSDKGRAKANG